MPATAGVGAGPEPGLDRLRQSRRGVRRTAVALEPGRTSAAASRPRSSTTTTCSRSSTSTPTSTAAIWAASARRVEKIVERDVRPNCRAAPRIEVRGQITTMQNSFYRLGLGMIFAVVLVYLLMAVNFQSWLDPFIILMALPGALAGIVWMLFLTQTTFSVPSLMGSIMCIGVATANSILLVVFANDQREEGMDARSAALSAGHTRIRPVLMTASAMIIGMLPMALGMGEGGEQNAPLGPRRDRRPDAGHDHDAVCGSAGLQPAAQEAAGGFRAQNRRRGTRILAGRNAAA